MLVLITGSSTYAFSLMLALYVAGVSLGSFWLAGKVARLRAPADAFAHLEIGAALLVSPGCGCSHASPTGSSSSTAPGVRPSTPGW